MVVVAEGLEEEEEGEDATGVGVLEEGVGLDVTAGSILGWTTEAAGGGGESLVEVEVTTGGGAGVKGGLEVVSLVEG